MNHSFNSANQDTQYLGIQNAASESTIMNLETIFTNVDKLASSMKIQHVDQNALQYIAQATQSRLLGLISNMVDASQHRARSQEVNPNQSLTGLSDCKLMDVTDVKKQLSALDRVDRESERQRKRAIIDREKTSNSGDEGDEATEDNDESGKGAQASGGAGPAPKKTKKALKKKKKDGSSGGGARDIANDSMKKSTNETALMLAGGVLKSWMMSTDDSSVHSLQPGGSDAASPVLINAGKDMDAFKGNSSAAVPLEQTDISTGMERGGRGRPRGRKPDISKRSRGTFGSSSLRSSSFHPGPFGGDKQPRKVTLSDAMCALERELDSGSESGGKALLRSYNSRLYL
ncbi:hypothetical protein DM01DRAFT_1339021, partial [Hesseltinella vesiculosa]